jgi:hypothetical protein
VKGDVDSLFMSDDSGIIALLERKATLSMRAMKTWPLSSATRKLHLTRNCAAKTFGIFG